MDPYGATMGHHGIPNVQKTMWPMPQRIRQGSIHHDLNGAYEAAEEGIGQAIPRAHVELAAILAGHQGTRAPGLSTGTGAMEI